MTTRPGDLSHLQSAHRPYALLANAERVDWIRQERWINYTRAEQILVRLGELLRYPPRHRMPALLQDHSYQLVLIDHSLAFGFQSAQSFVMLPQADRW